MDDKNQQNPVQVPPQPAEIQQPVFPDQPSQPASEGVQPAQEQQSPGGGSAFSPRNLIKLLIGLLTVAFVAIILFAFVLPNINKKEEKVNLSFWGIYEEKPFDTIISEFQKDNPKITVSYEKQNIKDYREKLTTRISQGTGPDIFRFHNSWYPMLFEFLLPIPTDVVSKEEFKKNFYPVAERDLLKDGAIYAVPFEIDLLSLFVNPEIFQQAGLPVPTNWDDFINTARSLTVKDISGNIQTSGAAFGTFSNVTYASDVVSLLMAQDGVDLGTLTPKQRVSDALSFYTAFAIPEGNVWDETQDKDILAFSKGNLAMYFGYYKDGEAIKSSNPSLKFDIVPVPQLSFPNIEIASYYPLGLSVKGKNQKEALLFLKYLQKPQVRQKIYLEEYKALGFSEQAIKDIELRAKNATSSYFASETFDNGLNNELGNLLKTAIGSILGGTSAETEAESLLTGFNQVLGRYQKKEK